MDEKDIDIEAAIRAAKQANIHMPIVSLEPIYQTVIGEQGVRLSGGQRQRLGIARALYSDLPVIVFDKGTSALENETEAAVMDAIDYLDNKTVLMAAHRLSTLKNRDPVYEVKSGQLSCLGRGETVAQRHRVVALLDRQIADVGGARS